MHVKDLLSGRDLVTVAEGASAMQAAQAMTGARVGAVIVTGPEGKLAGIFTERDLMSRVVVAGKDAHRVRLADVMTRDVFSVGPEESVDRVRSELQRRHIRHVPVVIEGKVVGVLSLRDLLLEDLNETAHRVQALESYMLGDSEATT